MKHIIAFVAKNCLRTAVLAFAILCLLVPSSSGKAEPLAVCSNPAVVCKSGALNTNETWDPSKVYVIVSNVTINPGVTLTIQPKTIVKFNGGTYLDVFGNLALNSSTNNEVIFTSLRDDTHGGDTNQDINNTTPAPGDWDAVYLENSLTNFHSAIVRYSSHGLTVWNATAADINPSISQNTFENNTVGVLLHAHNNMDITSHISNNVFSGNEYGLETEQYQNPSTLKFSTGTSMPFVESNDFNNNTGLPIYLGSSAFPTYSNNSFQGFPTTTQRLGIGLGGQWTQSGSWPQVSSMPYVVLSNTTLNSGFTVSIPAGTVIKMEKATFLDVFGTFDLQSSAGSEVIFTSFRDDTVGGDTNGDGSDLEPLPGDWDTIYLENDLTNFDYVISRYATAGVTIYNDTATNFVPRIENNTFQRNNYGVHYQACQLGQSAGSLLNNSFLNSEFFPILLDGSAYPTFTNNTFSGNKHPAIALTGSWYGTGTWPGILGDNAQIFPYVVIQNKKCDNKTPVYGVTIKPGANITIPRGTVFKFDAGAYMDSFGVLQMNSTPADADKIIFTSYKDDSYKGNTDGLAATPVRGDWDAVYIETPTGSIHDFAVKYSTHGISVYNTSNTDFSPSITNGLLQENIYGVYLYTENNGDITSSINNNSFIYNTYGLGTDTKGPIPPNSQPFNTGAARPVLISNSFTYHSGFPVFLAGTGYPSYLNNLFANNTHRAIGLGGYFNASGTLELVSGDSNAPFLGKAFPYVVQNNVTVKNTASVTILGGSIFKFEKDKYLDAIGTLEIKSSQDSQIYYTSYKDDYYDDTNADAGASTPSRGDWAAIYLESSGTNFNYATLKYSAKGVWVYNTTSQAIYPPIQNSHFEENGFAIYLDTEAYGDITSNIANNMLVSNSYGIGTYLAVFPNGSHVFGCALPTLASNSITKSSEFPLFYNGCANPVYTNNSFAQNTHPAIAVGSYWTQNSAWPKVVGDLGQTFPYVVVNNVVLDYGSDILNPATLAIPSGLIVKFDSGTYLYVDGELDLPAHDPINPIDPIIFTSYKDDTYAGDTNADGSASAPAPSDWKTIWFLDYPWKNNHINDIIAKYATAAIGIYYDGPANTSISTSISYSKFEKNHVGVAMAIGWANYNPYFVTGEGNIISTISETSFQDNHYGLVTFADPNATGMSNPCLQNVKIADSLNYPIYLGGTAYPEFSDITISNSALASPMTQNSPASSVYALKPGDLKIEMPPVSAEISARLKLEKEAGARPSSSFQAQTSSCGDFIANAQSGAIALGGYFNNSGTLPAIHLPFVLPGDYPLVISYYGRSSSAAPNLTIGYVNPANSNVTFPVGSVVKFSSGLYLDVFGKADLQGTLSNPVIFTSLNDDSVDGDTNRDGNATHPQKGDWVAVYLESSATNFSNAVVKYATEGLHLYFNGAANMNINPLVSSSIFLYNKTALTMSALGDGDILSEIRNNLFMNNDVNILGLNYNHSGRLMVDIHHNDIIGVTDYGVNNLSTNYTLKAQNNFWGDPSGPQHSTNPTGKGTKVSDRVNFSPWGGAGSWTRTYSIKGRIINTDPIPAGLEGVNIILSNGLTAQTNPGGYFSFDNLKPGNYSVTPVLNGYIFSPGSYTVNTPPDATDRTIVATVVTLPTYTIAGKITDNRGFAVEGVLVFLDNGASIFTDKNGFYIFSGLLAKSYKITAFLQDYTFTPLSRDVILGPNAINQDFALNGTFGTSRNIFLPWVRR